MRWRPPASGVEGLERIRAGGIDVVALDHYMPGQDGLQTLEAIRALPAPPPVVYVTGTQESRVAVAALKAGAADYVVKEVQGDFIELLTSAINAALEQVKMRRAHEAAEAEIRAARDRFEALAAERAMLLREMNHRVGNSLQIIMSLLHLQAGATDNEEVQTALSNARGRVAAVRAGAPPALYVRAGGQRLGGPVSGRAAGRPPDLRPAWRRGHHHRHRHRTARHRSDRAVALGVVVTELVINASKYAYPGSKGPVRVTLAVDGPQARLSVEDDGIGLGGETAAKGNGLGNRIVTAMASKLGASLAFLPKDKGTSVRMEFPLQPQDGRSAH